MIKFHCEFVIVNKSSHLTYTAQKQWTNIIVNPVITDIGLILDYFI